MLSLMYALSLKEQEQCLSSIYFLGLVSVRSYKAKQTSSMNS